MGSEDPVFPGNGKSKTLPVQTVYLIHFTSPGTNEEVCQKIDGIIFFQFSEKNYFGINNMFVAFSSIFRFRVPLVQPERGHLCKPVVAGSNHLKN